MNIDELLVPFREGTKVLDETIMLLSENGEEPCAPLFYTPEKILSVKSTDFTATVSLRVVTEAVLLLQDILKRRFLNLKSVA